MSVSSCVAAADFGMGKNGVGLAGSCLHSSTGSWVKVGSSGCRVSCSMLGTTVGVGARLLGDLTGDPPRGLRDRQAMNAAALAFTLVG